MPDLSFEFKNLQDKLEWMQLQFNPTKQAAIFNTLGFLTDQLIYTKRLYDKSQSDISDIIVTKTGQLVELQDRKTKAGGKDV